MASKPETTFYRSVNKLLDRTIYAEKMYNPLRGGTADFWYSGYGGDLWVEYKWISPLPVRVPIRMYKELTPLQQQWLGKRYEEGRNVQVILGSKDGCWVFKNRNWEIDLDANIVRADALTKFDIAEYINNEVCPC